MLLRRLEKLAPWHPSTVQPDERAQADRHGRNHDVAGADVGKRHPDGKPPGPDPPAGPDPPRPSDRLDGSFWDKVLSFRSLWQDHLRRWPDKPAEASQARPGDQPGSWRGSWDRYLSPEQNAEADRQIVSLRRPEKTVTMLLKQTEQENPHGGVLVGLEHRLKGDDRLKEKIVDRMTVSVDTGPAEAAAMIDDAVRYTFCFGNAEYVTGHSYVRQKLESGGYKMTYCKNHWQDDPQYKGVNSRWESPGGGRFELQFHTRESFYAKEQLTHPSYRRLRQRTTTAPERRELMAFERQVSAAVPEPPDISRIPDYEARM